jgi:hypothetical protein
VRVAADRRRTLAERETQARLREVGELLDVLLVAGGDGERDAAAREFGGTAGLEVRGAPRVE